ncbi:uncharacterized protein LOC127153429 [Labeo rohita]|uniref:uncharacterized protein LOC127153429 n=1 Tax=Labeo rohita TaxID=84645 RepID=UPI0021E24478|nr:uncharacterized protein LOC127153429 [Labeo rohita]
MKNVSYLFSLFMYLHMYGVSGADTDGGSVSVMEGDSVTLQYPTEINQQEDIMWYFNNIPIAEITGDPTKICTDVRCDNRNERFRDRLKLDHQTGSLTITNTRTTDSGLYDVWVSSKKPRGGGSYSVVVQGVPHLDTDEMSLIEGDSVTLHTGVKTNQQEKIKWYFNDIRIAQISVDQSKICTDVQCNEGTERFRGRLKLDNQTGSLTIMNVRLSYAGLYKLQIINRKTSISKTFGVAVANLAGVGTDEVSAYAMEGDSVILHTNVKTIQQKNIKWYFNDILIAQINGDLSNTCTDVQCNKGTERFNDRLKLDNQTGSLTITNINTTDAGLYQQKIISDRISTSIMKHFSVFVHGFPSEERDDMRRKSVKEGESVTLDPGEIKNLNDFLTWYFKDTLIAEITGNQSKICAADQCDERLRDRLKVNHTASLIITDMRTSDSGLYKLTITNIRFSIIKSFNVAVIGKYHLVTQCTDGINQQEAALSSYTFN